MEEVGNHNYNNNNMTHHLDCPEYNAGDDLLLQQISFWMEGVVQTSIAISGILFNLFSSLILAAKDMRNSFNWLLIALAFFDSCYLLGSILESFRKSFDFSTDLHTLMFPYFLYPGQMIMMTASVFMTVAIAMERYVAVHYPLDYNQSMNDENASLRRVLKYVVPVITFSIIFNIPKFFEAEIEYYTYLDEEMLVNRTVPMLAVSNFRKNPDYHFYYNNCARLFILGILPFVMLVFFNTKIYQDIQVRRRRRCPRAPSSNSNSAERQNNGNGAAKSTVAAGSPPTVPPTQQPVQLQPVQQQQQQQQQQHHRKGSQHKRQQNANRRRYEDNLAVIFMGIVLFFLISHLPRILMGVHEVFVSLEAIECQKAGKQSFAVWVLIATNVSHLLLVINGSVNSLIYCCFSSRFRQQVVKYFEQFARRLGLLHAGSTGMHSAAMTNVNGLAAASQLQIRQPQHHHSSVNGIRASHGMTTFAGALDESPLMEDKRNGLTQTTQV